MKRNKFVGLVLTGVIAFGIYVCAHGEGAEHPWKGRSVAFLGDSITDIHHIGCKTNYWGWMEHDIGIVPYVYGLNGRQWDSIVEQGRKLKAEHPDIDAILVFMGTNDYNGGVPLGRWYDVANVATNRDGQVIDHARRVFSTDGATLRGRINVAMAFLKRMFPNAQIIVMTPIHRGYAKFGETNVQPDESFANALGLYASDYVEAIKEVGNVWAVPVIDLNADTGLFPCDPVYAPYFHKSDTDMLHPNDHGHRRIAVTIEAKIRAYPAGFQER